MTDKNLTRNSSQLDELKEILSRMKGGILYKPIQQEIDCLNSSFPLKLPEKIISLPSTKEEDPFDWAKKCSDNFKNENVYILIPGRKFDYYGTRHGRGGGWYDRFLSKIPSTWLKIGVCNINDISAEKLVRNDWDQPMDWVLTYDGTIWEVLKPIDA